MLVKQLIAVVVMVKQCGTSLSIGIFKESDQDLDESVDSV